MLTELTLFPRSPSDGSRTPPRHCCAVALGTLLRAAKSLVVLGLSLRALIRNAGPRADDLSSVMYLAAGLAFRYAWVYAGRASATDDAAVAAMARGRPVLHAKPEAQRQSRALSSRRSPLPVPSTVHRAYGEAVRRTSLVIERLVRRRPAA